MHYFSHMNPKSRVWIYQASVPFEENQLHVIKEELEHLKRDWNAHGEKLRADYDIVYNQFILLSVDESDVSASGCSIDSSVNVIRHIEEKTGATLLDRMLLAYREKEEIRLLRRSEFKQAVDNYVITENHIVFDNTVQTVEALSRWEIPLKDSWHAKAFIRKEVL